MRGKPADSGVEVAEAASTPAYAGQTPYVLISPETSRLYPRICGANFVDIPHGTSAVPLPPHMRGKRARRRTPACGRTSTPAYAGQTVHRSCFGMAPALYPRICGANATLFPLSNLHDSSTPAYAGQTPPECFQRFIVDLYPRICGANPITRIWSVNRQPLPPHMRGKLRQAPQDRGDLPSTPAYAGQTSRPLLAFRWRRPLPPHMRGKHL